MTRFRAVEQRRLSCSGRSFCGGRFDMSTGFFLINEWSTFRLTRARALVEREPRGDDDAVAVADRHGSVAQSG